MPNSPDIPLHVYEVLEEEYLSLHGELSAEERIKICDKGQFEPQDREVTARRDWLFHEGHIRQSEKLIGLLKASDQQDKLPRSLLRDIAKKNLSIKPKPTANEPKDPTKTTEGFSSGPEANREVPDQQAASQLPPDYKKNLPPEPEKRVSCYLALLWRTHPDYQPIEDERGLRNALNKLLELKLYDEEVFKFTKLSETTQKLIELESFSNLSGSDLIHFNRLLLEDVYPDELEKIHTIRLTAMCQRLHRKKQAALCFSGGGTRSGTFALGLLQGLARRNLLKEFDYLSTVSGGGYIGGWLTAWIHRHPLRLKGVSDDLVNHFPSSKIDPDPPAIQHLRTFSNFITPKVGLLSADTWTFIGIYIRNLILNWLVFMPLILALLLIPRFSVASVLAKPEYPLCNLPCLRFIPCEITILGIGKIISPDIRHLFLAIGFALVVWAVVYAGLNRPGLLEKLKDKYPRIAKRTDQSGFLWWCLLPLSFSAVFLTTYWAWTPTPETKDYVIFGLFGLGIPLLGGAISRLMLRRCPSVGEVGALLVAGIVGGVLVGLTAHFNKPIVPDVTQSWGTELYVCFAVPLFMILFLLAATLFVGLSSHTKFSNDEDREWLARLSAWVLIVAIAWSAFSSLVIFGPLALYYAPKLVASVGGISGLVAVLLGRSSNTPANKEKEAQGGTMSMLAGHLLPILAMIFIAVFVSFLSLLLSLLFSWTLSSRFFKPHLESQIKTQLGRQNNESERTGLINGMNAQIESLRGQISKSGDAQFVAEMSAQIKGLQKQISKIKDEPIVNEVNEQIKNLREQINKSGDAPFPAAVQVNELIDKLQERFNQPKYEQLIAVLDKPFKESEDAQLVHMLTVHYTPWWLILISGGLLLVIGLGLSRGINLNLFSLHAGYRNRLIRGFLAASRDKSVRKPNPFTGFDPADNIFMHELRPALLREADFYDINEFAAKLKWMEVPPETEPFKDLYSGLSETTKKQLKFLYDNLSEETKKYLKDYTETAPLSYRERIELLEDLNRNLEREDIYLYSDELKGIKGVEAFAEVREQSETKEREQKLPTRDYHIHRNRLILEEAFKKDIRKCDYPPHRLFHVINMALNLVGSDNLAWQQRKAESFTVTPLHSGSSRVGYRKSRNYGGDDGISMGTAVAVSGAAASSNMGYFTSSPVLSLVMTLFNVRLGWWLGNPGPAGSETYTPIRIFSNNRLSEANNRIYHLPSPLYSVRPVLEEAFGLTDDKSKYVYLSDGGHFENLAFYEMVLRRCHLIVVSDGTADPNFNFNDLGNAVRKIRVDLGIPIEFADVPIYREPPKEEGQGGSYWAIGRIRYSEVDRLFDENGVEQKVEDGILIYIKPAVYGDEPEDVLQYKKANAAFPHETTADQFFDEPQFESHRILGSYIIDRMCREHSGDFDKHKFVKRAYEELLKMSPQLKEEKYDWTWLTNLLPKDPPSP